MKIINIKSKMERGSALILTVVISVLLAVIAVLFILRTSVDSIGTLSVSDNKELSYAIDTVLNQLKYELVLDVPGVRTTEQPAGQEYHDYPWDNGATLPSDPLWKQDDRWLACLEPYRNSLDGRYYWWHVSDLYSDLGAAAANNVLLDETISDLNDPRAAVVREGKVITAVNQLADADGDGIADSIWVKAMAASGRPLMSSKGKQMYLALRVVDLGSMLNANTSYLFDPNEVNLLKVDGSRLHQVNFMALAGRIGDVTSWATSPTEQESMAMARSGTLNPSDYTGSMDIYENQVAYRLNSPIGNWRIFDIGDELELRYRFILNQTSIDTRLEEWGGEFRRGSLSTPKISDVANWFERVTNPLSLSNPFGDFRHLATTFNCDRLIDPNGNPQTNINTASAPVIYERLRTALPSVDPNVLTQLAVNIKDYRDGDWQVSWLPKPDDPNIHIYGHSSPFMWISELAYSYVTPPTGPALVSYAVELYVPQLPPPAATDYRLRVGGDTYLLPHSDTWGSPAGHYLVLVNDAGGLFGITDPNGILLTSTLQFAEGDQIRLERRAPDGAWVMVDSVTIQAGWIPPLDTPPISAKRDTSDERVIRKLWLFSAAAPTPGKDNGYNAGGPGIQYLTKDADFTTIGELGNVLRKATSDIGPLDTEADVRFDWTDAAAAAVARYFTVMKSSVNGGKIYGRVNINTAPYFVLGQLPWMQYDYPMSSTDPNRFARARDIIVVRDNAPFIGFRSVADVIQSPMMRNLASDGLTLPSPPGSPDLSPDSVADDFEERDIIFSRISNLVTVRSDVFCAYILVRLGEDGPQKRVMVILDRSDVTSAAGKVKVRAFHPVPDPR